MNGMSICRGCGATIVWIKTPKGKAMPCDPAIETIVTNDGQVVKGRKPHWGSCPAADRFHRNRVNRKG